MNADFEIESSPGIVVLFDAAISPQPAISRDAGIISQLKEQARSGKIFLIEGEDASRYRIRILVEEELSEESTKCFESAGGSFRLDAPSGALMLVGNSSPESPRARCEFNVLPGTYLLQPMQQRLLDSAEIRALREELHGAADVRFARFVERLALGGCLVTLLALLLMVLPFTRHYKVEILSIMLLPWIAHFILRSLPRYRRIEKRGEASGKQTPHFILILKRSAAAHELPGGWIRGPE